MLAYKQTINKYFIWISCWSVHRTVDPSCKNSNSGSHRLELWYVLIFFDLSKAFNSKLLLNFMKAKRPLLMLMPVLWPKVLSTKTWAKLLEIYVQPVLLISLADIFYYNVGDFKLKFVQDNPLDDAGRKKTFFQETTIHNYRSADLTSG